MELTSLLAGVLIIGMLSIMAARAAPPLRVQVPGDVLLEVHPGPIFRILAQRTNIIAILIVLMLGSGLIGERWIPQGLFLFTLAVTAGLLCVPARYRLTTKGISPNRASFRPWSDFIGWRAQGNVIWLKGEGRFGSLKLYVGGREREEIVKVIRRLVKSKA